MGALASSPVLSAVKIWIETAWEQSADCALEVLIWRFAEGLLSNADLLG
jgi:hypothetical protein